MTKLKELKELQKDIINELVMVDIRPYSHNLVGLYLQQLDKEYGNEEIIKILKLKPKLWAKKGWKYLLKENEIDY